jgi:phosphoserine phosphatase
MDGSSVDEVNQATRRVLELKPEATIQLRGNISVPRPVVIPEMQALVMWLHCHNYHVYIVSATNRWAAAIIGADFFGVTEDRVIGVEVEVSRGRLTNKVKRPAPIGNGKVEAWQERLGDSHPLVVAGDSEGDHPLLNFVDKSGVVIWRGLADEKPAARPIVELS